MMRIAPKTRVRRYVIYLEGEPRTHWQGCRKVRQRREGSQYKAD